MVCRPIQFLVEVVADPAHRLSNEQGGGDRVCELGDGQTASFHPPDADQRASGDAAPDAKSPGPDGEDAIPHVRDLRWGRDVEVDPAADDAGRDRPQGDVADDGRVAAG